MRTAGTWKYKTLLLGFERLYGSHSAKALGKVTVSVLERFHITGSIRAITTVNTTVNTTMFRNLEQEGCLPSFTQKDCHVRCMGHIINLAVQSLLKTLKVTASLDVTVFPRAKPVSRTKYVSRLAELPPID